jgi:hypothetical protein
MYPKPIHHVLLLNASLYMNQVDWCHVYFIESSQHGCFILAYSLLLYDATSIILYALYHEPPVEFHRRHCIYSISLVILPPVPVMDAGAIFFLSIWLLEMEFLKRKLLLSCCVSCFWCFCFNFSFGPGSTVL